MARRKAPNAAKLLALKNAKVTRVVSEPKAELPKTTPKGAGPVTSRVSGGRHSAALRLASGLQENRATSGKVTNLGEQRSISNRVEHGVDGDGNKYLHLIFRRDKRPNQVIDASFLLGLPYLAEPFAEGLRDHLDGLVAQSRYSYVRLVRSGFVKFLMRHQPLARLEDIDRAMLIAYVKWQDSPAASAEGTSALSATTCIHQLGNSRSMLQALQKYPRWGATATRILDDFPQKTHKGARALVQPRATLQREVLGAIYEAALQEIEEIRERLDEGERLLAEGRNLLDSGCRNYELLPVALAAMVERYPGLFPDGEQLAKEAPELSKCVYVGKRRPHGLTRLARYRYACSRDLVPFVLLLAIEGAFNPTTVLALERDGVSERTLFGVSVTHIDGPKGRAVGGRYSKDLDTSVVKPWLQLLGRLTEPLRGHLSEHDRDRLFVYCPMTCSALEGAKTFMEPNNCSGGISWLSALRNFRKRHDLGYFSLVDIRQTLLDLVGQRHGALVAQHAGRHKSFQTTDGHYLGAGTRARERERLGETIQQMERFLGTDGKVDVRRSARPPGSDKGAATPGFNCEDPHDSPVPGQRKHRLCRAFGMCPACPMASAQDPDDYRTVAQWLALGNAINDARETLDPQHWLSKWAPVAARLLTLLAKVPERVLAKAKTLSIRLPPVG